MCRLFKLLFCFLVLVISIFAYGTIRISNDNIPDPLVDSFTIFGYESRLFNGWTLSHFLTYLILTFFFPEYWLLIFIIGTLWEIFEEYHM